MKKFRFVYWFCSITTEWYVVASNKEEAVKKFIEEKGERRIINIEEDVE